MGPSKKIVVIGDYQSLKEAFKDDKGSGRPLDFMWFNEETRHGDGTDSRGVLFSVVSNIFFQLFMQASISQLFFSNLNPNCFNSLGLINLQE